MALAMTTAIAGAMAGAIGRRGSHSTPLHYYWVTSVDGVGVETQNQVQSVPREPGDWAWR